MAKKKKTYTLNEVKERAFSYLQTTKFGGVYPS